MNLAAECRWKSKWTQSSIVIFQCKEQRANRGPGKVLVPNSQSGKSHYLCRIS